MRKLVWVSWLALAVPAWAAQPVHARHAMVVTAEQHATDAGVAVLEAGGGAREGGAPGWGGSRLGRPSRYARGMPWWSQGSPRPPPPEAQCWKRAATRGM